MSMYRELHDVALNTMELRIPSFMMHLIDRPLRHVPLQEPSTTALHGCVLMEFDKQIFREDFFVPTEERCQHCGGFVPPDVVRDKYEKALRAAMSRLVRKVNIKVAEMLRGALHKMPANIGFPYDLREN